MTIKIAVFEPTELPHSLRNYVDNVTRELAALGVDCVPFTENEAVPENADIYWDPGTGRPGPYRQLVDLRQPLIVTFHGAANLALPIRECFGPGFGNLQVGYSNRKETIRGWRRVRDRDYTIIAVSEYAKKEFNTHVHPENKNIVRIYHGIDTEVFCANGRPALDKTIPYFLHVSQYQPLKSVDRIIAAFDSLNMPNKPSLLLVVPSFPEWEVPEGVTVMRTAQSQEELAELYRGAIGFVFPSLRETFGMPILEAMASGCPVITSNGTGCAEVAGDAALLVDPRSVNEIASAMQRLITDAPLRASLREKGLARAMEFTWRRAAEQHLAVFEDAIRKPDTR